MSYGGCENTPDDLTPIQGATIESAKIVPDDEFGTVVQLELRLKDGEVIVNQDDVLSNRVIFQVWADPEGNGPGFLSFTGLLKAKLPKGPPLPAGVTVAS